MIFEPHLMPQLSGKRDKGEKIYENKCKTTYKTIEGGKTNDFDSWGRVDIRFCS